ncbi:MAG: hypothetical protein JWP89_6916 [Schlesneria sp.]|nr:hypothetical protein [Schlesneria sp.]
MGFTATGQVDRFVRQQSALTLVKCFDRGEVRLNVIVKRLLALAYCRSEVMPAQHANTLNRQRLRVKQ